MLHLLKLKQQTMSFNEEKKHLLKNPPKLVFGWVERTANYGNNTVTKGRKYKVLNHFCYLNTYGSNGEKYPQWDEFITLKNNYGYTVKMNLIGFTPCEAPLTKVQELEKRILALEHLQSAESNL